MDQLAAAANMEINVVKTTRGRLIPSIPSRYSMPKDSIHGSFTTPCISACPTTNWPGPTAPKKWGTATHRENRKTTAVVARVLHRMISSRALGIIGNDKPAATRAGKKTISVSGQKAGFSAGAMCYSINGGGNSNQQMKSGTKVLQGQILRQYQQQ